MRVISNNLAAKKELIISINKLKNILEGTKYISEAELEQQLSKFSQVKRFLELWQADPNFRQQLLTKTQATISDYHLNLDLDDMRAFIHPQEGEILSAKMLPQSYQDVAQAQLNWADSMISLAGSSSENRFRKWRERQIARFNSQVLSYKNGHFPVCFELSKGCSVGCWFCAVSAPRLGDIFFHNQQNARLWRDVLFLMKDLLGSAASTGFCYCATDPLDNPDYEKFLLDFYHILGIFPQTTTAQPLKDPERTRYLLKLSLEHGCLVNRFSILSLKMLHQLYQEFSAEELAFVELVLQNKEYGLPKYNAGRAREYNKRQAEKKHQEFDDSLSGTSACISGFLFNMIDHTVKLISPCNPSELYPLGYRVYDEGTFTDVNDLKILLETMIDTHMSLSVRKGDLIQFRHDLKYESLADGFQVSTRFMTIKFRHDPYLKPLGELILKGNKTASEIANVLNVWGVSTQHTFNSLNLMFNQGVLEEEAQGQVAPIDIDHN